jgi:hypothetical protein
VVLLQNTAEGGAAGATVTVGNSGGASGDAFTISTGTSVYTTGGVHGPNCFQANAASSVLGWNVSGLQVSVRFYFKLLATPTAAGLIHVPYTNNAATSVYRMLVNTSRQLAVQNSTGTQVAGGSATWAMTVGTWYRIETQCTVGSSTANGVLNLQLFVGDSTTPLATYSSTAFNAGTIPVTSVQIGRASGSGWVSGPQWDDAATQDSATAIGPYQAVTATASLAGSGTLTATGSPAGSSTAPLTGTGSLAASGAPTATQTAALTGTGTLSATGTAGQNGAATAALTGSGTLTATGTPRYTQVITMTGTGALTATGKASTTGTAAISGTGTLTATGAPSSSSAVNLAGSGTLTAVTAAQLNATAQLTGMGQLTAARADAPAYSSHTYGTAVIAPRLGTAVLATQALGTAALAGDGTSTATLAAAVGTAVLNTDTL